MQPEESVAPPRPIRDRARPVERPKAARAAKPVERARDAGGRRDPAPEAGAVKEEPAFGFGDVPASMSSRSKDGKSVIFRLKDGRSENGTGYLAVPAATVSQSGNSVSVKLAPGRRPYYGIVSGGKMVRSEDKPDAVLERVRRDAELARRHEQAAHMDVPGVSGGKELENGTER